MSPGNRRKVSVIVPTRDRPDLLREALESIRTVEAEANDLEFEILVGDNGSADTAVDKVVASLGAIHLRTSAAGSSATRNLGLEHATGEFIAFLDDDDLWIEGHIRPQIAFLDAHPDMDAVVGQTIPTGTDRKPFFDPVPAEDPGPGDALLRSMLGGYFPQIGTCVCRGDARAKYGLFDLALLGGQDLDWLLRFAHASKLAWMKQPCVYFRVRPPGSYDKLNKMRVGFDRKVFLRHASRSLRIWRSPVDFAKAYSGTLMHFYDYFREALHDRAEAGDRIGARSAFWGAMRVFPLRVAKHTLLNTRFRRSTLIAFGLKRGLVDQ